MKKSSSPSVKQDYHVLLWIVYVQVDNWAGSGSPPHMGPEGVLNWKKTPIFFVDAKRSQIAQM